MHSCRQHFCGQYLFNRYLFNRYLFNLGRITCLVIFLLFVSTNPARPESPSLLDTQNAEISKLYEEGRYTEGVALARRYLAEWEQRLGPDSPEACSIASNLGPLLTAAGDLEAAGEAHRRAIACLEATSGPQSEDLASALNNYGQHLGFIADFGRAEVALRESLRLLRLNLGDDHIYVAITLNNLGINQQNQGNPVAAERTLREAVARLKTSLGSAHQYTATAVNNLGRLLVDQGALSEAEPLLREALAVRDSVLGPDHEETAIGRRDLGRLYFQQNRLAEAEEALRNALRAFIAVGGPRHPDVAMTRHDLARVLAAARRPQEAREQWEQALALNREHYEDSHSSVVQIERELGELDFATGNPSDGLAHFLTAAEAFEKGRALTGEGLSRATYLDSPWRQVAAARLLAGDEAGAWQALTRTQGRVLADALYPGGADPLYPGGTDPLAIDDGTVVIGWLDVDPGHGLHAWAYALRAGQVHWYPLADPESHGAAAGDLRESLAAPGSQARLRQRAFTVWRQRVAPLDKELAGARRVMVVPSGPMLGVPLAALLDADGRWLADRFPIFSSPSIAYSSWVRQAPARTAGPALLVGDPLLRAEGRTQPPTGTQPPTLVQGPSLSDDIIRGAAHGVREDLARLPSLPGTRQEILGLVAQWDSCLVLLGADATEEAVVDLAAADRLAGFRVLHFATHALVDANDADASALVLSQTGLREPLGLLASGDRVCDGLITSGEIAAEWRLDADLVVLSACNSALGRQVVGEGLVGFAHVFLRRGARAVLASQWSVPDRAARLFMNAFYRHWRTEGLTRAAALAAARRDLRNHRDADGRCPYGHPYYWASFELVGDER